MEMHLELDDVCEHVGARIQQVRQFKRMSQTEMAGITGLNRAYLSAVENGHQNMNLKTLHTIAQGLGVSMSILVSEKDLEIKEVV